jgi:hypothetical protein
MARSTKIRCQSEDFVHKRLDSDIFRIEFVQKQQSPSGLLSIEVALEMGGLAYLRRARGRLWRIAWTSTRKVCAEAARSMIVTFTPSGQVSFESTSEEPSDAHFAPA